MTNIRTYGQEPFHVVVLHGGPGAPGEMAPVAKELGHSFGVLEPLQSAYTISGQIEELREAVEARASYPVVLIGHSWGAWLGYLFASRYPSMVSKLILIGSGPYEAKYVQLMNKTRASRFTTDEKERMERLMAEFQVCELEQKKDVFREFGRIMSRVDSFDLIADDDVVIDYQPDVYEAIMEEVGEWRKSGRLKELGRFIRCPVVAFHGDYDCHPPQGVEEPLSQVIADFKFVLLRSCGHCPWKEARSREEFFHLLKGELWDRLTKCNL